MLSSEARQSEQEKPTVESVVYPIDVLGQLHPNGGLTNVTSYLKCYLSTCLADGAESETAIDHKIEQAMDLVKNHLLFAVHEEIELLKKQIVDLMSRNEQLEIENEFLRSMALPETLNQIKQQQGQQPQQEQQQQNLVAVPPQPVFF